MFRTFWLRRFKLLALLCLGLAAFSPQSWGADNPKLTTLHRFASDKYGQNPEATLTLGSDGCFYGTTAYGGLSSGGTVFRVTPAGVLTTLHQFTFSQGVDPMGALVEGADGAFYGATRYGGSANGGVAFRIAPDGRYRVLHVFDGVHSGYAATGMTRGPDGALYGSADGSSAHLGGEVYRLTTDGAFSIVHEFSHQFNADAFQGYVTQPPVFGPDGALYGATYYGGAFGAGVLFRLTLDGTLSVLHAFHEQDGRFCTGLTPGPDGLLYGVMFAGGLQDSGSLFRATFGGHVTILHKFSSDGHGAKPYAALSAGPDRLLYGTTFTGGFEENEREFSGRGTVFSVTPAGRVTTLYKFHTDFDGFGPVGGVAFGANGLLYGTAESGGAKDFGTVYSLSVPQGATH